MTSRKIFIIVSLLLNVSCASTPEKEANPVRKTETFGHWNQSIYAFNQDLDDAILKPIAQGYLSITSESVEKGVTNFFSNINDIGVTVNDLLQFKITQSGMDASRFIINTTAGVLGVMDVANMVDLPKHNEDFGQTLGFWGIPAGDYLMLPFVGPSSPRDAVGLLGDALLNPFNYTFLFGGGVAVTAATTGLNALDVTNTRANLIGTEKMINEAATDRYQFIKNAYEQRREYLIHDGNVLSTDDVDLLNDEESVTPSAPSKNAPSANTKTNAQPKPVESVKKIPPQRSPLGTASPKSHSSPAIDNSRHLLKLSAPK